MEKYVYWGAGIIVLLGLINSCNSSARRKQVITYDPYAPINSPIIGRCDCMYDYDKNGNLCGKRSAWYRTGGAEPVCYLGDKYGYPPNRRG